jgi:hypothetical protein
MTPLLAYTKPSRALASLLGSLIFIMLGAWMLERGAPGDAWKGWATIGFFALGAFVSVLQLFDRAPRLVISDAGVLDRQSGIGQIEWHQIAGAAFQKVRRKPILTLRLADGNPGASTPLTDSRRRAFQPPGQPMLVNIDLSGVRIDSAELMKIINGRIEADAATTGRAEAHRPASDAFTGLAP